jgi:SAM-dependent methyltransferase
MNTTADRYQNQIKPLMRRWFEVSPTRQAAYRRMAELMGPTGGRRCLAVLAEDVLVSYQFMEAGGTWDCVGLLEDPGPVAAALLGSRIEPLANGKLPYEKELFDIVLLDEALEYFADDAAFIAECHRVLKPTGRLIIKTEVRKRWSLLVGLRGLFGFAPGGPARVRPGYTESLLFGVLKDGFDTEEVRTWSRFFAESFELLTQMAMVLVGAVPMRISSNAADNERALMSYRRLVRLVAVLRPFAWLAGRLDWLLPFTRGHRMVVRARHRAWKPRRTPTLTDGRSIADAAINTKIGTASPF